MKCTTDHLPPVTHPIIFFVEAATRSRRLMPHGLSELRGIRTIASRTLVKRWLPSGKRVPSPSAGDRSRGVRSRDPCDARDTRETQSRFRCSDSSSGGKRIERRCAPVRTIGGWKRDLVTVAVPWRVFSSPRARAGDYALDQEKQARAFCSWRGRNTGGLVDPYEDRVCGTAFCVPVESFLVRGANDKSDACCRLTRFNF